MNNIKIKFLFLFFFLVLITKKNQAQFYYGNALGGYGGIKAIELNPANVAASPYRVLVDMVSLSATVNNNFISGTMTDFANIENKNGVLRTQLSDSAYVTRLDAPNKKYDAYLNLNLSLLNFMFNVGRHNGFAITAKVVSHSGLFNFDYNSTFKSQRDLNNLLSSGIDIGINNGAVSINNPLGTSMSFKQTSLITNNFAQIGLTYGRNIIEEDAHTFKVGFTYKYLVGLASASFVSKDASLGVNYNNQVIKLKGDGAIQGSYNSELNKDNLTTDDVLNNIGTHRGFGIDIGGIYEWNPDYNKDTTKLNYDKYANPYKLKLGFSIIDLGKVNYDVITRTFDFSKLDYSSMKDDFANNSKINYDKKISIDSNLKVITAKFNITAKSDMGTKSVSLPTLMRFYADYHIKYQFYVAANFAINIAGIFGDYTIPIASHYVVVPRIQTQYFDLSLPFTFIPKYLQFKYGFGLRLFGLYVGSDDINGLFTDTYGANFYAGFRLGFGKLKSTLKKYYLSKTNFNASSSIIPASTNMSPSNKKTVSPEQRKQIDENQSNMKSGDSKLSPLKILN